MTGHTRQHTRLVRRPAESVRLHEDKLPTGLVYVSVMSEPPPDWGVSIEYLGDNDAPPFALFINCSIALARSRADFEADPQACLERVLTGTRSFAESAEGRVRLINGLTGYETTVRKDDRFETSLTAYSGDLIWQAHTTSTDPSSSASAITFAETLILPQFLENTP